jgi:Flp pilus assembly protein TadD
VQSGQADEARRTLEPLLSDGPHWRQLWLELAAADIQRADTAVDWVKKVAPQMAAGDPREQTALATAWYQIAVRTHDADANAQAAKILDPIVERPTAPGAAVLLRAAVAERDGDFKTAEAFYRRGIALLPNQPESLNNLAYLIYLRGGDLAEARKLATRAVGVSPDAANFLDTLARIQARQGDRDAAVATFRKAIKLDPDNLEALVGLATTLCDAGQRDAAMTLLPQIDTAAKARPTLTPQLRREVDNLHNVAKASL